MLELDIINTIKNVIGNKYIGDDCAYLKDFGITVSHDTFVEGIHFKLDWASPYQIGYKAIVANISDILASGAIPKYATISLSLPPDISLSFVEEFYKGVCTASGSVKIIGGDVTGSKDKIMISVAIIGDAHNRNISSRKYAKPGYIVVTNGIYGASAAGLHFLKNNIKNNKLIKAHLEPELEYGLSEIIAQNIKEEYAMMDTSDGLADALFKIANSSNVNISIDYNNIPHPDNVTQEQILYGGEDYNLIAAIPKKYKYLLNNYSIIGNVSEFNGAYLDISGEKYTSYNNINTYNHFGEHDE